MVAACHWLDHGTRGPVLESRRLFMSKWLHSGFEIRVLHNLDKKFTKNNTRSSKSSHRAGDNSTASLGICACHQDQRRVQHVRLQSTTAQKISWP